MGHLILEKLREKRKKIRNLPLNWPLVMRWAKRRASAKGKFSTCWGINWAVSEISFSGVITLPLCVWMVVTPRLGTVTLEARTSAGKYNINYYSKVTWIRFWIVCFLSCIKGEREIIIIRLSPLIKQEKNQHKKKKCFILKIRMKKERALLVRECEIAKEPWMHD